MELYIGNGKQQTEKFTYRVPDAEARPGISASGARVQDIGPGAQLRISGDLTRYQIDSILDQHRPYGLIELSELNGVRAYAGLIYSIDKPIPADRLAQLMGQNIEYLEEKGRDMREMAAVATNAGIESQMQEQDMPGRIKTLEMEVVEERTAKSEGPEMAPQRIRVTRDQEPTAKPAGKARGGNRRRAG